MGDPIVGVVAGVGPYAGLDMLRKIFDQTIATGDHDHLTVVGWYQSCAIPDRAKYLLGEADENPGYAIGQQLLQLENAGAQIAAIPCNTAHAPAIIRVALDELNKNSSSLRVLNMIDEVAAHLASSASQIDCVGVLSTVGTYDTEIYPTILNPLGYKTVVPPRDWQIERVDKAIFDADYGLKSVGCGTEQSRKDLIETISLLKAEGAQAIILGCTELPLAFSETSIAGLPLIDPTCILARAVIREAAPTKLKPLA